MNNIALPYILSFFTYLSTPQQSLCWLKLCVRKFSFTSDAFSCFSNFSTFRIKVKFRRVFPFKSILQFLFFFCVHQWSYKNYGRNCAMCAFYAFIYGCSKFKFKLSSVTSLYALLCAGLYSYIILLLLENWGNERPWCIKW